MIIDRLVLVNGEIFEGYRENEYVPKRKGFIAIYKQESDPYTRYINTNYILYAEMENGKIEKADNDFNILMSKIL